MCGDRQDVGATSTEYALLVGFVAVAIGGVVMGLGVSLNDYYDFLRARVVDALP